MSARMVKHWTRWAGVFVLTHLISACAPMVRVPGPSIQPPAISDDALTMADGAMLPLYVWQPKSGTPRAVVIALHGFNDYGLFFHDLATYLADDGVVSYAYDQRGFGGAPNTGYWAGSDAYIADMRTSLYLVKQRHPGIPIFLFGESMGGAVLMAAATAPGEATLPVDGLILAAPAVWARETMPFYQRWALWLASHTMPWLPLSGRGLKITPSDNIEMLRALGRDPLVIKETRVDAVWGLANLMDRAMAGASRFDDRSLILYGALDEIIKKHATMEMLRRLPTGPEPGYRIAFYKSGYHMLIRDLEAETYWRDIADWINDPSAPLASRADVAGGGVLEQAKIRNSCC